MNNINSYDLIRRPTVLQLTARSKSALYLDEKNGTFCPPIAIGIRAKAYIRAEVEAIVKARVEGQNPEQIKQLVSTLIQQRTG